MKKITTQGEPISFRVDGATLLEITAEGCLATDEAAAIAIDRLGGNIAVEDVTLEEAAKEVLEEALPVVLDIALDNVNDPTFENDLKTALDETPVEDVTLEDTLAPVPEEVVEPEAPAPKPAKKSKSK